MYINELAEGMRLQDNIFLCKKITSATSKNGKTYMNVELVDKTGSLDGKIWSPSDQGIREVEDLDYVVTSGEVTMYNGSPQYKINKIQKADEGTYNPADFVPVSRFDIDKMYDKLLKLIESVKNPYFKALLDSFFVNDPDFKKRFIMHSAAKSVHHGFAGGLLEHTLSVASLCDYFAKHYGNMDRDLLVTAAICHDIGKVKELSDFPENSYTDEGQLVGHIIIGTQMITEHIKDIPDFPEKKKNELVHCILAHHGQLEFGSPKVPALIEAVALSHADNLDAKLETFREALENGTPDSHGWIGFNRFLDSNVRATTPEKTEW